jgi:hypothetical protein
LQYGDYKIEAYFENDLEAKTEPVIYSFSIAPPYWRTWWFYSLINLGLLGIMGWAWKQRLASKRKEE